MSEQREKFVDELLDKALANYSQAEPRMGLEGRVRARLEEEKAAPARAWWWKWAWAPAAAALLIAGALYLARPTSQPPTTPNLAVKSNLPGVTPAPKTNPPAVQSAAQAKPRARRNAQASARLAEAAAKQAQFPVLVPLSEQERLLLAYVKLQPEAAALQAKAAAEPLTEIEIQPLEIQPLNPDENDQVPQH